MTEKEILKNVINILHLYRENTKQDIIYQNTEFRSRVNLVCMGESGGQVSFVDCIFSEPVHIYASVFKKEVNFRNCAFLGDSSLEIIAAQFHEKLIIEKCKFASKIRIVDSVFKEEVMLGRNQYSGLSVFEKDSENFGSIAFEKGLLIY